MKSKQLCPKSVRPVSVNNLSHKTHRYRVRCSLCDSLLKASTTHRYLLMCKSVHDKLNQTTTYAECCERYLSGTYESDKLHMLCPKCCHDLQRVYALHNDAEQLIEKIRHTCYKTKRLNRARETPLNLARNNLSSPLPPLSTTVTDDNMTMSIKQELEFTESPAAIKTSLEQSPIVVSETVIANKPYDLSNRQCLAMELPIGNDHTRIQKLKTKQRFPKPSHSHLKTVNSHSKKPKKAHLMDSYSLFIPTQVSHPSFPDQKELYKNISLHPSTHNSTLLPFAHLMIESPLSSSSPSQQTETRRRSSSTSEPIPSTISYEPLLDEDQSCSPPTNDDDASLINEPKSTRLSRRQYDFFVKLPDQQSLNAFIETSSAESGSRWTWRRTSANSRGYKVYYVCNFSMRRHYHPCPAAMYALFHPEGSISIYSCGQHQHIPKDRLPVSITDATKDEIFKCLQAGMATTDIRERLTRLQLPFGDTRKLNNFIKYHKELLRFGTVTNVRIGGTAYRQPQCWAIRRQPGASPSSGPTTNDEKNASADNGVS